MEEYFEAKEGSKLWAAVENGTIKGSICIVKKSGTDDQLRLFGTDPSLQGMGIGKQLMQKAMDFCREKG